MFQTPLSFKGRIRRTEYAISVVGYLVAVGVIECLLSEYFGVDQKRNLFDFSGNVTRAIFRLVLNIPIIWFLLAQGAKRSHDLGRSGWWQLMLPLYWFMLVFVDGIPGTNEWGFNAAGVEEEEEEEDVAMAGN